MSKLTTGISVRLLKDVETLHRYGHNKIAHAGLEFAQHELSDAQREWLSELPERTEFADDAYRLVHSHPDPNQPGSYVRPAHRESRDVG